MRDYGIHTIPKVASLPATGGPGQVVYYLGAQYTWNEVTNQWQPSAAAAGPVNPRLSIVGSTDFLQRGSVQDIFTVTGISSGTFSTAPASGVVTVNHPGVILLRTSTSSGSGCRIQTEIDAIVIGGGEVFDCVFRTSSSLLSTNSYRMGFLDTTTSADATDGAYFEITGSGVVTGKTALGGTRTASASLVTLAANTWYHVRVTVGADAKSALFQVYSDSGALLGSATNVANLPTGGGIATGAGLIATTTAALSAADICHVDYISVSCNRTLVRGALS